MKFHSHPVNWGGEEKAQEVDISNRKFIASLKTSGGKLRAICFLVI